MAEDSTNPFAAILGSLRSRGASQSTSGVRNDTRPGSVSPVLTPSETARYTKIFGVMKSVMNPGPEAKRVKTTKAGKVGGVAQMQQAESKAEGGGGIPFGKIIGGLALAAGVIGAALATLTDDIKEKFLEYGKAILDFGGKVAVDLGHIPAMALKLAGLIPFKILKGLPLLGSLINFGMSWDAFNRGDWGVGLWELVSGIAGLFPGIGTGISIGMDMIMWMYESNNPKDDAGNRSMSFGDWIWNKTIEIGTKIWDAVVAGKVPLISGLYKFGEGIVYMMSGNFAKGFESWSAILPAMLGQGDNEEFLMAFDAFTDMLGEGTYNMAVKAKKQGDKHFNWIADVFSKVGNVLKGMFTALYDWVDGAITAGLNKIKSVIPEVFGGGGDDFETSKEQREQEETDRASRISTQLSNHAQMDAIKDKVGLDVYREAMRQAEPDRKAWLKKQGYVPTPINDGFISKDGNVTRFDDQDDILAAKSGGPIDKLLDANSAVMGELNSVNKNQLNVLISIRDGINMLVSNAGSSTATGGSTATGSSTATGGGTEVQFTTNPLTQEFYA